MLKICLPLLFLFVTGVAGQAPDAAEPEPFGDGVFTGGEIFRGSFAPDGRTFYFFKKVVPGQEEYRIFASRLTDGKWTAPRRVGLGGEHSDLYPAVSKDGRRLVFVSYRPVPGVKTDKPNAHLWYADRQGEGWGEPVFMAKANLIGHYHAWAEFGRDDAVYFRRITPDWRSRRTLVTRWNGTEYAEAVPFEEAERLSERLSERRPDLNVNGGSPGPTRDLIFFDVGTRDAETGRRASDIWVAVRRNGEWLGPAPLGPGINGPGYDVFPFFSPDGRTMYFVRDFREFRRIPLAAALAPVEKGAFMTDLEKLVETERDFARTARAKSVRQAFLEFFAPGGVVFQPGPVGALEHWEKRPESPALLAWDPVRADISSDGRIGYTTGGWEFRPAGPDGEPAAYGQYVTLWERQPGGEYKAVLDIGNTHPKPAAPEKSWTAPESVPPREGRRPDGFEPASGLIGIERYEELLADDVRLYRPEKFALIGKKAALAELRRERKEIKDGRTEGEKCAGADDLMYCYGFLVTDRADGSAARGNLVRIWKFRDGKWRIVLELYAPLPA